MIPAAGSCRKEARKSPEIAECGSSIPTGNLLDFFPVNSSQFPAGTGQKSSGNGRKISGGNTASGMYRDFAGSHQFLPYVLDPGCCVAFEERNKRADRLISLRFGKRISCILSFTTPLS